MILIILKIYIFTILINMLLGFLYLKSVSYNNSISYAFKKIPDVRALNYFKTLVFYSLFLISLIPICNIFLSMIYLKLLLKPKFGVDIIITAFIMTQIKKYEK